MEKNSTISILHVFDQACNLINHEGDILSLVTAEIGPGPFAIVVPLSQPFNDFISVQDVITIDHSKIALGNLTIETGATPLWQPRPDWESLNMNRELIAASLPFFSDHLGGYTISGYPLKKAGLKQLADRSTSLIRGITARDLDAIQVEVRKLAGLGSGLTPSGDDFLMGVLYGLWATNWGRFEVEFAGIILRTAVPRTTSLSGAWLKAAARGEAAHPWHDLVMGFRQEDQAVVSKAILRILDTGSTSGVDALSGFLAVIDHV